MDVEHKPRRSERIRLRNIGQALLTMAAEIKEPITREEALASSESAKWDGAMDAEIKALVDNQTWIQVRRPEKKNVKARLVAKGFTQEFFEDFTETFAPVARKETMRIFLSICARRRYNIMQFDVPSAYVKAALDEEIFMEIPTGFTESYEHGEAQSKAKQRGVSATQGPLWVETSGANLAPGIAKCFCVVRFY